MDREFNPNSSNSVKLSRSKKLLLEQASLPTSVPHSSSVPDYSPSFIKDGTSIINKNHALRASVSAKSVGHPRPTPHLPSHTEIHSVSPSAAGFPVLEVVRVLESENILTKDDRLALKDGLYSSDVQRREEVVKALCDVELSMHSKFSIRRLKSVIHQNASGLPNPSGSSSSGAGGAAYGSAAAFINNKASSNSYNSSSEQFASPVGRQVDIKLNFDHLDSNNNNNSNNNGSSTKRSGAVSSYGSPSLHSPDPTSAGPPTSTRQSNSKTANQQQTPQMHLSPTQIALQQFNSLHNGTNFELDEPAMQIQNTINKVVGDAPLYSGPSNYNVLEKISARFNEFESAKAANSKAAASSGNSVRNRKYCVIVGCGSFNPLTRMHLRTFYLAKQYVENKLGYLNLGTLLSPAHGVTVRERFRTNVNEIIPSPHRLAVAQLLVQNSKWLSIDPWEISRRRPMDYLSLLEHVQAILRERFPETDIKVFYFSKGNMIPKISPIALKLQNFGCVCVTRAPESDMLRGSLSGKWNGVISVVEDAAILDASVDIVTSRKVRDKIRAGESVAYLVGEKINDYALVHHLGPKMNGEEEWTDLEKALPKFASRPAEPALRSQSGASSVIGSSSSMKSIVSTNSTAYTPSWSEPNAGVTPGRNQLLNRSILEEEEPGDD